MARTGRAVADSYLAVIDFASEEAAPVLAPSCGSPIIALIGSNGTAAWRGLSSLDESSLESPLPSDSVSASFLLSEAGAGAGSSLAIDLDDAFGEAAAFCPPSSFLNISGWTL